MPKVDYSQGKADKSIQETLKKERFSFGYFNEVIAELKKSTWPTRDETIRLTILVISISAAIGVILGVIDLGFSRLLQQLL